LLIVKERKTGIKGSSAPGFVKTGSQNCRLAGYLRQNGLKRLFAEKCSINQITFARDSVDNYLKEKREMLQTPVKTDPKLGIDITLNFTSNIGKLYDPIILNI
jgi:hypothetical protein